MAGTIVLGSISTEEVLSDEKKIEMDEKIRALKVDEAQYVTMTTRLSNRTIVREKANWIEEEDFPRTVTASTAATNVATSVILNAGHGLIVAANDILRNMRTGEAMRISSIATDTITVARNVGSNTGIIAAAVNVGDVFLVVADAQPQGSDFPSPRYLQRVLGYNYTQITRTTYSFTNTQTAIELFGGREPAKEVVRKVREHKKKWENIGFFGPRNYIAQSPRRTSRRAPPAVCSSSLPPTSRSPRR
jgi:hypothetical protein